MPKKNHSRVVLVTGAAKRIGAAVARCFHQNGYRVIIHYRHSQKNAEALAHQLNQYRKNSATCIFADLDQFDHYDTLIKESFSVWKRLDVLINNASTFFQTPVGNIKEAQWDALLNSNLKAPFFLSQNAAPMLARHRGSIINIVDIHATRPMKHYPIYSCAKAGLLMMTKALALELAPKIRVNAVAPGHVMWPTNKKAFSMSEKKTIEAATLLQKKISPDDIAKTALFLAEQASITGQMIAVDGGRLL